MQDTKTSYCDSPFESRWKGRVF